ncbi:hypothetical protein Y032_0013g2143 [Ancylostoma ceylanicum]|uniref:Uncharacterized protein n=1 Tax=Ancylostoma ceylanicum TaxID=53326 RepID=A0A016VDN7_9BILA|nr:hypothetical protein Y032_0013g2143 [Ancylostoma ceylanicum]
MFSRCEREALHDEDSEQPSIKEHNRITRWARACPYTLETKKTLRKRRRKMRPHTLKIEKTLRKKKRKTGRCKLKNEETLKKGMRAKKSSKR